MSFLRLSILSAMFVSGCAQGGGLDTDSGAPASMDAGGTDAGDDGTDAGTMMGTDAGPDGTDAGTMMGTDAGPDGTDAGTMMGTDAGVMTDAGFDAGPPVGCTSASECDDGLRCNGSEGCVGGTCTAGTPFACDDGISCTRDTCVEGASPTCNFAADDALCPAGETCGGSGCMGTCADTPCRLVGPQCGCPGVQGCYLSGSTRLCATAGSTPIGASCAGVSSCVPGGICINVSRDAAAPANMCNRFCDADSDCGGGICLYTLDDGTGATVPGVTVCTSPCDPIAQTGCPSGTACSIFRETMGAMRYFSDCSAPVGTGAQFATCAGSEDCRAGYGCVGSECLEWCDRVGLSGSAAGCPIGLTCYGFTTPIVVGGTTYGVCDL